MFLLDQRLGNLGVGDERSMLEPEREAFLTSYTLLRTDQNGWIHLSTDGKDLGWRWRGDSGDVWISWI
jgi:hypothetical protein